MLRPELTGFTYRIVESFAFRDFTVPFHTQRWSARAAPAIHDNTKDFSLKIIARDDFFIILFCAFELLKNFYFAAFFQELWSEMFKMLSRHRSIGLGEEGARAGVSSSVLCMRPVRTSTINR